MFWHFVRIPIGFALASLAAAATLVLFVYAPSDWEGLRAHMSSERLSQAGIFALFITPWVALCAAAPALAGVAFAESHKISGSMYYALAGLGIAIGGFFLQYLSEAPGRLGIFQAYALIAFLTAGLVGGLVYWALAGRYAAKVAAPASKPS